jgi:sigma-E factor negative regulatory protein RseB
MRMRSLSIALVLLCAAMPALPATSSEEARAWIKRMNKAVTALNYEAVIKHSWNGNREHEVLRIIHRVQDDQMSERVMFIGSGNESIRKGSQYVEFYRSKGIAVGQTQDRSFGFLPAFNGISADSDKLYLISNEGPKRLDDYAGQTQLITVMPRDDRRFGYRFWLDPQSAMPIMTEVVTASRVVIDRVFFMSLSLKDSISDDMLKPPASFRNFDLRKPFEPAAAVKQAFVPRANLLPAGFHVLNIRSRDDKVAAAGPETRFIVSDGISWASVFISVADGPQFEGLKQMSPSTFTYQIKLDGHYVTVMGEVPPQTVQAIAMAVHPE